MIPPGGKGTITLTVDTKTIRGEFRKKALVWSNDPNNKSVTLRIRGKVVPHISINPGGYISLFGKIGQIPAQHIVLKNNHTQPLEILTVEHDLGGLIKWQLKKEKPGYVYKLDVEDTSKEPGTYNGHLYVKTDNPQKPELIIIVNGQIEGN